MRKIVVLLTGVVFILGVMVPLSYAQLDKEKKSPLNPIPKQDTVHIGVDKKDKKDAPAAKTDPKTPAAPDQKAVVADQPTSADTKTQAPKQTKKAKKSKKKKTPPKE